MKLPTVFITYNPGVDFEETLAIRLHTIGAVHGFDMLLPERSYFNNPISQETINRIRLSDFFIIFSTTSLSDVVHEEIQEAFKHLKDRSKIIIVYDSNVGRNLKGAEMFTEIYVDSNAQSIHDILQSILSELKTAESKNKVKTKKSSDSEVIGGLILAGLGLLLLGALIGGGKK